MSIIKKKNNINYKPFIIYLPKKQAKENIKALNNEKKYTIKFSGENFKKICMEMIYKSYILNDIIIKALENEMYYNPGIYFPPKNIFKKIKKYWDNPEEILNANNKSKKSKKQVILYKPPINKSYKFSPYKNKKDLKEFIKKLNLQKKISIYYLTKVFIDKEELKSYLNRIKKNIKMEKKFGQKKLIENKKPFYFSMTIEDIYVGLKGFFFYLTKRQIS